MPRQPKMCKHKATGQAYVRIAGKMIYLGNWGSAESREAYDAAILKWRKDNDATGKHVTTIGQLCLAYQRHAETFYRDSDGEPTGEAINFQKSLKTLVAKYRSTPCSEFGPLKLKQLQSELAKKHVRTQVNKMISRVKQVFRWGVAEEMVPAEIVLALDCVKGLQKGRSAAREGDPVVPVPIEDFNLSLEKLSKNIRAICQLLLHTGARVSEIRLMRVGDIDTTGQVWLYRPGSHKNAWRGKDRTIFIGPKAQAVLLPFIADAVQSDLYVFRPRSANEPYKLKSIGACVRDACIQTGANHWSPSQLRHNTATNINQAFGDIDASRVILGHSEVNTTQVYAERDLQKAAEIAAQIG